MPDLRGDKVLVLGAGGSIGSAICRELVDCGAEVVGLDLTIPDDDPSSPVRYGRVDLADPAQVTTSIDEAVAMLGGLDGLVNAAGVLSKSAPLDLPLSEWERIMDINLRGPFVASQAAARHILSRENGGYIVNITSVLAHRGRSDLAHYSASKGGLTQLTKSMAVAYGRAGLRVNAIAPGAIRSTISGRDGEEERQTREVTARIPLGYIGEPEDISGVVAFLASRAARYITGTTVVVDGGTLAMR